MHHKLFIEAIAQAQCQTATHLADFLQEMTTESPLASKHFLHPACKSPDSPEALAHARNLPIWDIDNADVLSVFLECLGHILDGLELPSSAFMEAPLAYGIVRYVLRFEEHLLFDSWLALQNVAPDLVHITHFYRAAGMASMADAVVHAAEAWENAGGHEGTGYEAAQAAINVESNLFADEDERWDYLVQLLRNQNIWVP